MTKLFWTIVLLAGCVCAQDASPASSPVTPPAVSNKTGVQQNPANVGDFAAPGKPGGKVGLVRGTLKRLDPIHDQLLIHTFGGGNVQIAFDVRTQLLTENSSAHLTSIPAGSIVSVDTVIDNGKVFARSVRTAPSNSNGVELNGQVVHYDATRSRLTLRDPISPENVSLRVTPSTTVVNQGKTLSLESLAPGMLVRVWFSPNQHVANNVEILAERGKSFTFQGRILAVDLRSRILALSNDTDQSVRELAIGSLDSTTLGLLQEGNEVIILAEFDGDRYNVRTVTPVSRQP